MNKPLTPYRKRLIFMRQVSKEKRQSLFLIPLLIVALAVVAYYYPMGVM